MAIDRGVLRLCLRIDELPIPTCNDGTSLTPRIAVIDSGVHAAHSHVQGVAGGVGVDEAGEFHDDFVDRLGHGTAVAAVIREKVPFADIFAVKIFDRDLRTTSVSVARALQWARSRGAHVINLSLGTTNTDAEEFLAEETAAARAAGGLVVSAAPQDGRRWLPGALPGVIRVETDMTLPRDACDLEVGPDEEISARASGYPRPVPGVPPEKNLRGQSFAVANVTGILARLWSQRGAWPEWSTLAK